LAATRRQAALRLVLTARPQGGTWPRARGGAAGGGVESARGGALAFVHAHGGRCSAGAPADGRPGDRPAIGVSARRGRRKRSARLRERWTRERRVRTRVLWCSSGGAQQAGGRRATGGLAAARARSAVLQTSQLARQKRWCIRRHGALRHGLPAARPACSWAVAHAARAHGTLAARERSGEPFRGGDQTNTCCNAA
jgi:hypothetical protein